MTGTVEPVEVQLSPCVGGLLRTWTADGTGTLWSVPRDSWLRTAQGSGGIARREIASGRFREVAQLTESKLTVRLRRPVPVPVGEGLTMEAQVVDLEEARRASRGTFEDVREVLVRAVERCVDTGEYLLIERGGKAPDRPTDGMFCLFALMPDGAERVVAVETAPAPRGSELWAPYVDEWGRAHTISAPASSETVAMAPTIIIEAIREWDLDPWDLVFTYGAVL